jgi:hypothetical protein
MARIMATGVVAGNAGAGAGESGFSFNHLVREVQWLIKTGSCEAESPVVVILVCRSGFWNSGFLF